MNPQKIVPLYKAYTAGTAIAAVLMLRAANKQCTCLLVEGPDDLKLFRKLTADGCAVIPAGNRPQVVDALEALEQQALDGVAGVVDRDYSDLNPMEHLPSSALTTGENDVELMLMNSDALRLALQEALANVPTIVEEAGAKPPLLDWLLGRVAPVGRLRAANCHKRLGLNFNGLSLRMILKRGTTQLDEKLLVAELVRRTSNALSEADVVKAASDTDLSRMSLLLVCQGHDAVQFATIAVEAGQLGHALCHLSSAEFGRLLRACYTTEAFKNSELHRSFAAWDAQSAPYALLPA